MVKNKSNQAAGFTLLELMIVIALISIVSTLAIPQMSTSVFSGSLKSTTRTLIGFISETKQEAIRKRTNYTLIFDMEHNAVFRESGDDAQPERAEDKDQKIQFEFPEGVSIQDILLVPGNKKSLGGIGLHFNTKGYSEKAFIHLVDDEGEQMTIVVSPFLGISDIKDGYLEPSTL